MRIATSMRRRLALAMRQLGCQTLSQLQDRVLHDAEVLTRLLQYLTVPVTDMFRDPLYFRALRESVVPVLRTYPSLRIWIAGCSSGEEVYSFAILLREAQLLARTMIYATDINAQALRQAAAGVFALTRLRGFTENHRRARGRTPPWEPRPGGWRSRNAAKRRSPGGAMPRRPRAPPRASATEDA